MTCFSHSLIGLIEIEPRSAGADLPARTGDCSTLQGWLETANSAAPYPVMCASGRFNRSAKAGITSSVRADLAQLVDDLQAEYERVLNR